MKIPAVKKIVKKESVAKTNSPSKGLSTSEPLIAPAKDIIKAETNLLKHPETLNMDCKNEDERRNFDSTQADVPKRKKKIIIVKKTIVVRKKAKAVAPTASVGISSVENQSDVIIENATKQPTHNDSITENNVSKEAVALDSTTEKTLDNGTTMVISSPQESKKSLTKSPAKDRGGIKDSKCSLQRNKPNSDGRGGSNILTSKGIEAEHEKPHHEIDHKKQEEKSVEGESEEALMIGVAAEGFQCEVDEFDPDENDEEEEEQEEDGRGREEYTAQTRPIADRQKRKRLEVFVGGLDKDATEADVRHAFKPLGDVVEVRLMMNPVTGKNKGYAFVRFGSSDQAARALTEFAVTKIRGKECGVLPNQDNDTLFIGNISRDWKSSEVFQKLREYGIDGIEDLTLIADPHNEALNRGYAFLELATHYDAVNAFQRLQKPGVQFCHDRPSRISWAQPLNEPISVNSEVKSVFVDGIPSNWTDDNVKQNFGRFGEIERTVFARDIASAKRKDFAFVNFVSPESASACVEACQELELLDEDRKVKVKVSFTRRMHKNRGEQWSTHRDYAGQSRGQLTRVEGWSRAPRFGSKRGGRGFDWNNGRPGYGRKRLDDEEDVLMLGRTLREEQGSWASNARGRGSQYGKGPTRGAHSRNRESKSYNDRRSGSARPFRHREQDVIRVHSNHLSDSGALRGRMPGPGAARDDYKSQHFHQRDIYPSSRSVRADHYVSPHDDSGPHIYGREGAGNVHDYGEPALGMKRPASVWDEDSSYYSSNRRAYPRGRVDYGASGSLPETIFQYSGFVRSPSGPSVRQGRTSLAEPYYDGGSGVGKIGTTSAYDDYNTMLLDTAAYVPERRDTSMYPSYHGGHMDSTYDLQGPRYY